MEMLKFIKLKDLGTVNIYIRTLITRITLRRWSLVCEKVWSDI